MILIVQSILVHRLSKCDGRHAKFFFFCKPCCNCGHPVSKQSELKVRVFARSTAIAAVCLCVYLCVCPSKYCSACTRRSFIVSLHAYKCDSYLKIPNVYVSAKCYFSYVVLLWCVLNSGHLVSEQKCKPFFEFIQAPRRRKLSL